MKYVCCGDAMRRAAELFPSIREKYARMKADVFDGIEYSQDTEGEIIRMRLEREKNAAADPVRQDRRGEIEIKYDPGSYVLQRSLWLDLLPGLRQVGSGILAVALDVVRAVSGVRAAPLLRETRLTLNQNSVLQDLLIKHFPESPAGVRPFQTDQVELHVLSELADRENLLSILEGHLWARYEEFDNILDKPKLYLPDHLVATVLASPETRAAQKNPRAANLETGMAKRQLAMIIEHQSHRFYHSTRMDRLLKQIYFRFGQRLPEGVRTVVSMRILQQRPLSGLFLILTTPGISALLLTVNDKQIWRDLVALIRRDPRLILKQRMQERRPNRLLNLFQGAA